MRKPGYDFRRTLDSEGWWQSDTGSLDLSGAVDLLRAFRQGMREMSTAWYTETYELGTVVRERLASALGLRAHELDADFKPQRRRRGGPLPPRQLTNHRYLGAFDVQGSLRLADPCYGSCDDRSLVSTTPALAGRWHSYTRCMTGQEWAVALLLVHDAHPGAAEELGHAFGDVAVDSGRIAVLDTGAEDESHDEWFEGPLQDGILGSRGCVVTTPHGDGSYEARRHLVKSKAVMVRVNLTGDPEHDGFG